MTASDYPISFPYGATSAPYSATHPHRGDDRACPQGTPIVINGVTIGLTGATGKVTGPHLHIQETQGGYLNTRKPQNAFKGGTVINIDPNGTQGDGSFGKFIDIRTDDGWTDSYCHLSQINVQVGQKLEGGIMDNDIVKKEDLDLLRIIFSEIEGHDYGEVHSGGYDDLLLKTFVGLSFKQVTRNMFHNSNSQAYRDAKAAAFAGNANATVLKTGLYEVK